MVYDWCTFLTQLIMTTQSAKQKSEVVIHVKRLWRDHGWPQRVAASNQLTYGRTMERPNGPDHRVAASNPLKSERDDFWITWSFFFILSQLIHHTKSWCAGPIISELLICTTDDSRMVDMPTSFMYPCIKFAICQSSQFYNRTQPLMFYHHKSHQSCKSKAPYYIKAVQPAKGNWHSQLKMTLIPCCNETLQKLITTSC